MERALPVSEYPALRAGILKVPGYPSARLRPCITRLRFIWRDHGSSTAFIGLSFRLHRHPEIGGGEATVRLRWNSALLIKSLVLLKMVPKVIDPVMAIFQLGSIERQTRTIEATNICMMNLLLVIHPSISRLQTGDIGRQTIEEIVGWNHDLRIIFPDDCIDLNARED